MKILSIQVIDLPIGNMCCERGFERLRRILRRKHLFALGVLFCTFQSCDYKRIDMPSGNHARTVKEIETVTRALQHFFVDVGRFPTDSEALGVLYTNEHLSGHERKAWDGPYLVDRGLFRNGKQFDWFGSEIRYVHLGGPDTSVEVRSAGLDRVFGTADDIAHSSYEKVTDDKKG